MSCSWGASVLCEARWALSQHGGLRVSRGREKTLQDPVRPYLWNSYHATCAKWHWSVWIQTWRNRLHVFIGGEAVSLILQSYVDTGNVIHWGLLFWKTPVTFGWNMDVISRTPPSWSRYRDHMLRMSHEMGRSWVLSNFMKALYESQTIYLHRGFMGETDKLHFLSHCHFGLFHLQPSLYTFSNAQPLITCQLYLPA